MIYIIYILVGLTGGVLIGMAGLTAVMVLTPILAGICFCLLRGDSGNLFVSRIFAEPWGRIGGIYE